MKTYLCLILMAFNLTLGIGQSTLLTGQVIDENSQAVAFAHVVLTDVNDSGNIFASLSDDDGRFSLELPKIEYLLEISIIGYESISSKLDLRLASLSKDIGSIIITASVTLDEITIIANSSSTRIALDKKVYDVSDDKLNSGGNLLDIMENVPSVQVEVDGNISIRGSGDVQILIDGKVSGLSSSAALLKTIPAGTIDKIEVVTNPSSKYSSEGSGGIVNVVLKKGSKRILSSSLELFSGFRLNSGANLNVSKGGKKNTFYLNLGSGYSEPKSTNSIQLEKYPFRSAESIQNAELILKQFYFLSNTGGRVSINDKSSILADFTYRAAKLNNTNDITYRNYDSDFLTSATQRLDDEKNKNIFLQFTTEYELRLDSLGSELKLSLLTQTSSENGKSTIRNKSLFPPQTLSSIDYVASKIQDQRYDFAIDYIKMLSDESQFEFGFRNRFTFIENEFGVERSKDGQVSQIPEYSDETSYRESVLAFYAQYAKSYLSLKFQLGLRSETTQVITQSEGIMNARRIYTNLFPSSFVSYEFNDESSLRLSISRRIRRPRRNHILPFSSFTDSRNVFLGNPDINPSYIVLAELAYETKLGEKVSISPSLFLRNTRDMIQYFVQETMLVVNGFSDGVFVARPENVGDIRSSGIEISASYQVLNWLKIYNEITLSNFSERGRIYGENYSVNGTYVYGRINMNSKLTKSLKFQIQQRFVSPRTRGKEKRSGIYRMDAGLSITLLKGNATISLNMKDIFDTWEWHVLRTGEDFTQVIDHQIRTPQFTASFIYLLNQQNYEGRKGRQYDRM